MNSKVGRGRPRKHPEGTTATERVNISIATLKMAGGARKIFRLSPEAMKALKTLQQYRNGATETEIVESALIAAVNELND